MKSAILLYRKNNKKYVDIIVPEKKIEFIL